MSNADKLADWIILHSVADDLTPLKLQKLLFYAYGTALAFDVDPDIGPVPFEAWPLGPVNRGVWSRFKEVGSNVISAAGLNPVSFESRTERVLSAALDVYGNMTAAQLVDESHRERPYRDTSVQNREQIEPRAIKNHFRLKFAKGRVLPPSVTFDPGSFRIDGVNVVHFDDLFDLASHLKRARRK